MAWWLVDSIMNGTLDEDYPVKEYVDGHGDVHSVRLKDDCYPTLGSTMSAAQDDVDKHSTSWYDYKRNDPNRENPFTDPEDKKKADDLYSYHYPPLNNEVQQSENMTAHYYKYHEEEILKDIESYVSGTYRGHYTGDTHEYRNVQTLDLMAARSLASAFCQSNILKYGSRYGSKDGKEKKDLLKVIHYAMLLLHFDEHYGKPKMTTGNIDHTMP